MNTTQLKNKVKAIVEQAAALKDKHTKASKARVNYACIFCHNHEEFASLTQLVKTFGSIIKETPTGPLFHINPIETIAGDLRLLKIRAPDPTRTEQGDADFTIADFLQFKETYLAKPQFKLINREQFVMIELMDPAFDVRAYFSHPPLTEQLKIT